MLPSFLTSLEKYSHTVAFGNVQRPCAICLSTMNSEQGANTIFTAPCSHSFHLRCIKDCILHGNHGCPLCRSPLSLDRLLFDDDDPLPAPPSPPPPPAATIAVHTLPEFPAIAAAASPSSFTVLTNARAPSLSPHRRRDSRAALDLVAVLDVSGSMNGRKLVLLKHAVGFIIRSLAPSDRLAIVAFSLTAHQVLNLRLMSDAGQTEASNAIDSLVTSGGTDIAAGLSAGIHILENRRFRNPVTSIILLSDGIDRLDYFLTRQQAARRRRLFLNRLPPSARRIGPIHAFGLGVDHDPVIMHAIAEATGGTFSFVEEEAAVSDAFATCLAGLISVVAQRVQLKICAASPGVRITSAATGNYSSRISEDGLRAIIRVGDLYAEEEKNFLLGVAVPIKEGKDDSPTALLRVHCSYTDPLTREVIHVEENRSVVRRPDSLSPEDERVNVIVDGQRNRILVTESIAEAQAKADEGDLDGAKAVLDGRRAALQASSLAQAGDELCACLDRELQEIAERMADRRAYEESGRAYMLSGMSSQLLQRAALRGHTAMLASAPTAVTFQTQTMVQMVERSREWGAERRSEPGTSVAEVRPEVVPKE